MPVSDLKKNQLKGLPFDCIFHIWRNFTRNFHCHAKNFMVQIPNPFLSAFEKKNSIGEDFDSWDVLQSVTKILVPILSDYILAKESLII